MKKKIKYTLASLSSVLILLTALYAFFAAGFLLNDKYTLISGGNIDSDLPYFISADKNSYLLAGSEGKLSGGRVVKENYTQKVTLKLFNAIPLKEVSVSVVKSPTVVPSGSCIGVKIHSNGLIAVGLAQFRTPGGYTVSPAGDAGIKPGDIIETVNGRAVSDISGFLKEIDKTDGGCQLGIVRDKSRMTVKIFPKNCEDGHKRLGIMVRDSTAGIGTMTYYDKSTGEYAALGHGISDSDTEVIIPVRSGAVYGASILGISKGKKGAPGEIIGAVNEQENIGSCTDNTETGIYGKIADCSSYGQEVEIASKSQVQKGKATVICTLDKSGPHEYEMEIVNISRINTSSTKSMIIKVTDPALLKKTGGIIQGMSGSPIIQNGRLVGAVTHVFINDPQKGYAIFAETMMYKEK